MMDMTFFAEMAWKSALISGAALALAAVLRSRAAADRALVLRIGVTMLLALPLIAAALPALQIEAWAAPEPGPAFSYYAAEASYAMPVLTEVAPQPTIWDDPTPLIVIAYLAGLLMVGGRLTAGLWRLGQWTRSARPVNCPEWMAAFERVRWTAPHAERMRLMVSDEVPSPLSWGWLRPVILIDPDTLDQPGDAEAILAHEVAHVARSDWPVLILSRVAATLFWFNPLVWLLEREVVQQAEEAADADAVERIEPARYAQTLLSWARTGGGVPAHSIAPSASALARRMKAILDRRLRERPAGSAWTAAAILLCIGIAAPVAAVELVAAARAAQPAPSAPASPAPSTQALPSAPAAPVTALGNQAVAIAPEVEETLDEVLPRIPEIVASATAAINPEELARTIESAVAEAHAAGHLSRAEIDAAKAEAIRGIREAQMEIRHIDRIELERKVREAHRASAKAHRRVALSLAHGAEGMMRGAEGMEAGARRMDEEAARLQDPAYRQRQIARARARGETVTHEELLEAAEGLREGAEGMREGAEGMRESAREMRERRD